MSAEQALERSVLERKERDELHTIAEALGVKTTSRTKKADLIDKILAAAGIDPGGAGAASEGNGASGNEGAAADATAAAADGATEEVAEAAMADTGATAAPEGDAAAQQQDASTSDDHAVDAKRTGSDGEPDREERGREAESRHDVQQQNQPQGDGGGRRNRRRRGRDRDFRQQEPTSDEQYQGEPVPAVGLLEVAEQGYGFVRTHGYLPQRDDLYVSVSQVRRFGLRKGDHIEGAGRPPVGNEKYGALLRIDSVNGQTVEEARNRPRFEDLTPLFPDSKLRMETKADPGNITGRIIDLICPIGKGQRGMIVSPPKAGKTTVIKQIATSIEKNHPDVHLMVLLVDERPEEVTDMRRSVKGEVVASTFDRPAEEHTVVAELALERAKRLTELGKDVVIILDGITRLARAYNLSAPASGRLTSGGIDQAAIYPPKKFFGAARNVEEGGSLTILATALVETGSRADDVIFEEFKGTGNMELRLDRRLAERRIYPAIDVNASSTRHEELLFGGRKDVELVWRLRRVLNGLAEDGSTARSLELLMEKIKTTKTNDEFLAEVAKAQGTI